MCLTRSSQDLSSDYFHSGLQHTQTRGGQVQTWAEFYIQNLGFPFSSSFFLDYLLTICNPSSGTYSFKKKKKGRCSLKEFSLPHISATASVISDQTSDYFPSASLIDGSEVNQRFGQSFYIILSSPSLAFPLWIPSSFSISLYQNPSHVLSVRKMPVWFFC